jgi:hypothetical protein
VGFSTDTENYTLEYMFQHMPGSLPAQSQKMYSSQPKLKDNGLKYHTKEADQHKKKLKEKPNMPKEANTGSTKLPLPITTQL